MQQSGPLVAIAELHAALAQATTAEELLTALLPHLAPHRPQSAELHYLLSQEGDQELGRVAAWSSADATQEPPHSALSTHLLPAQLAAPAEVLLTPERAILCLYARGSRTWQGLLILRWLGPHQFTELETALYRTLSHTLTAFVALQRSQSTHDQMLAEMRTLYEIGTRLNAATSTEEILKVLAAPVSETQADHGRLYTMKLDEDGVPEEMLLAAEWGEGVTQRNIGDRRPPSTNDRMWMRSPDAPVIVDDLSTDREGPWPTDSLRRMRQSGVHAVILMPLRVRNRWVGMASLMWRTPYKFTDGERRLFQGVMRQAAVALDNRLHIEQMEHALKENQEGRLLLSSILDSLPIGVWVLDAATLGSRLANRGAQELAAQLLRQGKDRGQESEADSPTRICRPGTETPVAFGELPLAHLTADSAPQRTEFDVVSADGSRQSFDCIAAPLCRSDGSLDGIIAVFSNTTDHKRAVHDRIQMQSELIRTQEAALAERSTPMIPITDRIMVMPIIGSIDSGRSTQILDSLLLGISRSGAQVAVIDITGVGTIDSNAALGLLNAARAARLVGTEVVLTGIRAEVAQTVVKLGIDLKGIATYSTLQGGIAHAQRRWGSSPS